MSSHCTTVLQNTLRGEGEQPDVVVHSDTNDIDRKKDEVLQCTYRHKIKKQDFKGRTRECVAV